MIQQISDWTCHFLGGARSGWKAAFGVLVPPTDNQEVARNNTEDEQLAEAGVPKDPAARQRRGEASQLTERPPGRPETPSLEPTSQELYWIAPYRDGEIPTPDMYRPYPATAKSPSGFAFLASAVPSCEELVVALEVSGDVVWMIAEVLRFRPQLATEPHRVEVECRLTGRIEAGMYRENSR